MNGEWVSAAPAFLVAAGLLLLPGLAVRLAGWNVRSVGVYFLVPAMSVAILAVAANLAPLIRLPWSPLPVALVTALAVAAAYGLRRWVGREELVRPRAGLVVVAAVGCVVAAALIVGQLAYVFVGPQNISQTFDNIVHLNSIRLALDTANSSALEIGRTSDIGFYPNAWHSIVTLTAELTGSSIPLAVNAANLAIGAVAWPISCIALACAFFRGRVAAVVSAAALSTGFGAFPIMLMSFGVLYPNATGYAILPAGLAAVWWLLEAHGTATRVRAGTALLVVAAGIGLAHPNAFLALFAMGVPMALLELLRRALSARSSRTWAVSGGIAAVLLVAGALLWRFARTGYAMSQWGPWTGTWQAIADGLLIAPRAYSPTLIMVVLLAIGFIWAARRPWRLIRTIPFLVALFLFVIVSGTGHSFFRDMLTNPWYNDSYRLAALLPIAGIPVVSMGVIAVVDAATGLARRWRWPRIATVAIGTVSAAALFAVAWGPNVQSTASAWRTSYVLDDHSALLTLDEMRLIERLRTTTPADALILGNPWTGASLALALGGRDVVERHVFGTLTSDEVFLDGHLRDIASDPAVCRAIDRVGADYVLDFGSQNVFEDPTAGKDRAGLDDLTPSRHLVLVDSEGPAARLFRIEGC